MNLLGAMLLLLFTGGRWPIAVAAWLAPVFLLRFARGGGALPRLLAAAAALYGIYCITWWGMVPVPAPAYFAIMLVIALPTVLPYVLDRLLVPRGAGFAFTLVFPCAWVVGEYLVSLFSPYGSWGSVAYTQVDPLALLQSASIAGLWGIAFLMAWFASVLNWAWERSFRWGEVRAGALAYAGLLSLTLLWGGARLAFEAPAARTFRFASVTAPWPPVLQPALLLSRERTGAALDSLRAALRAQQDSLTAALAREARAGAKLVAWSEVNAFVLKSEAAEFEARLATLARESGATVIVGVAEFTPGAGDYENLLLAFGPTGRRLARYHKARPVPGDPERGADRAIPVFDTPVGRIAGAVCFDADFPDLIRRAGAERADVLVVPASDWRAIDPIHTRMAVVRGVENGCAVARQTHLGLSAVADHQGRLLAASDDFRSSPNVMVAQIPARGVRTFYARHPALMPELCGGALVLFLARALRRRLSPNT
ncbi:MAG: nitrilase-related carbon-nitrogen hydrolase [Candidatus Eiseniibacteriota bacterium]